MEVGIDASLFGQMKDFLRSYFCEDETSDKNDDFGPIDELENSLFEIDIGGGRGKKSPTYSGPNIDGEEEIRGIPGGRYGCTQYLKFCGPEAFQ